MRVTRKEKKKLRVIIICHTGNYKCHKIKLSKADWLLEKKQYTVWFKLVSLGERKVANGVNRKSHR
jgi:hypothetical protein